MVKSIWMVGKGGPAGNRWWREVDEVGEDGIVEWMRMAVDCFGWEMDVDDEEYKDVKERWSGVGQLEGGVGVVDENE